MAERPKIAAIVTTYNPRCHADLIVSKFATGFPTDGGLLEPRVDLVSLYMDQVHGSDMGTELARAHGIAVYPSIRAALTLEPPSAGNWPTEEWRDGELAVDGVLIIAEHGDYAMNERERRLYPRRHFFEQSYHEINLLAGVRSKSFIAEVMPQFPLRNLRRQGFLFQSPVLQLSSGSFFPLFFLRISLHFSLLS